MILSLPALMHISIDLKMNISVRSPSTKLEHDPNFGEKKGSSECVEQP